MRIFPTGTEKIAQEVYRGDPNPIDLNDFNPEYGVKELGKDLGSSAAYGPGIYFAVNESVARQYGSNITKKVVTGASILTSKSKLFTYQQIEKMLKSVDKETMEIAVSNWDDDYRRGKQLLINSIVNGEDAIDQIMTIWADVYYHQNPEAYMRLMTVNGIDGIKVNQEDLIYYIIYNRNVLK
jgi:hypothetical protein